MLIPFSVDFPDEGQDETEKETEKSNEDTKPAFVKDALAWLILNSQDSNSIDVAIGALVVGKVGLELDRSLQSRINSHLVKHFSGSFYSSGDGVKLQLQSPENSRQSVLDYVNWMSYFARDSIEHIAPQILRFEESFKLDTVTQLGLALACLAQDKQLPRDTGRKVALWLSSFIKNYNENALYFNPEVLSAMIDGLTATSFHCRLSANGQNTAQNSGTSQNRLQYLAISDLTDILWKVSLEKGSPLRASIGVNLAVFALTSNLIYPFDNKNFQSAAYSLAFDYGSTDARDEKFISFLLFAVLGILHPLNRIDLSQNTVATMCSLIQETRYLDQAGFAVSLPYLEDLGPVKLKRCLTAMLIEIMVQPRAPTTPPDFSSIVLWFTALHISTSPIFSLEEFRQFEQMVERIFTLPAGLHRICALICVYAQHEDTHLKEGALIASMDLLYEQVKTLSGLDFTIIEGKVFPQISSDVGALEPAAKDVGHLSTSETLTPASSPTNSHIDALGKTSPEQIASHTLALVLKRSNDKQCIEIAVRAILLHSNKCSVELVMKATRWFEDRLINISPTDEATASGRILNLSGYIRILTSMALHCPDRAELSKHLNPNASNITERHTYLAVDAKIESLAVTKSDPHIHAFSVAALAVWRFACPDDLYCSDRTMEPLKESWSLISTSANDKIGPEALEALIDTTVLFTAVTKSACTISDINSQMLLRLFSHPNLDEEHVRPALAVAVTFWGLSLDNWSSFWEPSERKRNWREIFTRPEPRKKHQAALFLLGLSRFLEHSTTLRLDHTSIQTIATEINRYMQQSNVSEARLTLPFLPAGFDVRRHVREVVASYLRETENQAPFPKSVATSRSQLLSAIQLDGGEGFQYEVPQPFARNNRQEASTSSSV